MSLFVSEVTTRAKTQTIQLEYQLISVKLEVRQAPLNTLLNNMLIKLRTTLRRIARKQPSLRRAPNIIIL